MITGLSSVPLPGVVNDLSQMIEKIGPIPGLAVTLHDGGEDPFTIVDYTRREDSLSRHEFALQLESLEGGNHHLQFTFQGISNEVQRLIIELFQSKIDAFELLRREEALLDELGANWENLENLYELSAELQGSNVTTDIFQRLLGRLGSSQRGVRAGLFIEEGSVLVPVAARDASLTPITWEQAPSISMIVKMRQVAQVDLTASDAAVESWSKARSMAVAPVTTRNSTLGFLIMWKDHEGAGFDSSQLRLLEAIAYQAAITVERDRLLGAIRQSERLEKELEIAGSIHQMLLVAKPPASTQEIEIAGFNQPSQKIDGDFHEYLTFPDGTIDVIVGDVMGKGVSAALVGAATKNALLKAVAKLSLFECGSKPEISEIVSNSAAALYDNLVKLERFVTLCYGRFDMEMRTFTYVDCGHTGIMLNRKQGGELRILRGTSLPLGVKRHELFEATQHQLLPGDCYLLYSDGVTEAQNRDGELFGEERLGECLQSWSSLPAADVIERIRAEVIQFSGTDTFADDFTCVAVKISSSRNRVIHSCEAQFPASVSELGAVRGWVRKNVGDVAACIFEEGGFALVELAVDETFANCVLHGKASPAIHIVIELFGDRLQATLSYRGTGFEISKVALPAFDGSRQGGFGIFIVARCADELSYRQLEDGTHAIRFIKYFKGK